MRKRISICFDEETVRMLQEEKNQSRLLEKLYLKYKGYELKLTKTKLIEVKIPELVKSDEKEGDVAEELQEQPDRVL